MDLPVQLGRAMAVVYYDRPVLQVFRVLHLKIHDTRACEAEGE